MSKKKLTTINGHRPAHRACRPSPSTDTRTVTVTFTGARRAPGPPSPVTALPQAPKQKQMSRATLLKRLEELRQRDAKKKAQAAKAQARPRARIRDKATSARTGTPATRSQPYYGVEMKYVNGQWVQMHPESE
ncbi:hypothetical protein ACIQXD_01310 [Streptomyces uncialis]|uniref:hypothetical protein n=1 Tax=Streptomyces uncialis TaxID=1048205 RepID=UPI00380CEC9B